MTKALPPSPGAHHILKFIYQELQVRGMSLRALSTEAGVSYNAIKEAMRRETNISLASAEACLNALGFTMKPTVLEKRREE